MSFANSVSESNGPATGREKTLVVGLGNPILGDDGIGWCVAQEVKRRAPDAEVECLALGGLSLMERLIGYDRAVIIDAIQTSEQRTGTVRIFPLAEMADRTAGHMTAAHDTSLQTALELGRQMGARLPVAITVVAIEADRVYDFSEELSPAVAAAVPAATAAVLAALADIEELRKTI